jgi:hypothetical protein
LTNISLFLQNNSKKKSKKSKKKIKKVKSFFSCRRNFFWIKDTGVFVGCG